MTAGRKKRVIALVAAVALLPVVWFFLSGVVKYQMLGARPQVRVGQANIGRTMELRRLAAAAPEEVYSAVVLLDDYYPLEAAVGTLDSCGVRPVSTFQWVRGETGRSMRPVEDGPRSQPPRDMTRVPDGSEGVFALVVEGTASQLNGLGREVPQVFAVDVEHNGYVELQGKLWGKTVSYVYLPQKPDGAL